MSTAIAILLAMLFLSAFFSGSEMAFLASNKLIIEINRPRYPRITRVIDIFMARPSILISTILIGNNVAMVIYSLVFGDTVGPILGQYTTSPSLILLAQTLISTVIIIVTAEFLPKSLIQLNPSAMLNVLALPLFFFFIIFYPLGVIMQGISSFIISVVFRSPQPPKAENILPSRVDFDNFVSQQADVATSDPDVGQEARLMRNALDFSQIKVRDCFVPRTDLVVVDEEDSVEELHAKFLASGLSKVLVYRGSIDNIVGYVHVSDMFSNAKTIKEMTAPIAYVPETMRANVLLKQFTGQHKSIAIVVDEFGGTAGVITLEDVLEEIFGEIVDEHDQTGYVERQVDESSYVFSARLEVDYVNEKYGLRLPASDDYDTLAGLLLHTTQSIPHQGDEISVGRFDFKVVQASHSKVEKVLVRVREE